MKNTYRAMPSLISLVATAELAFLLLCPSGTQAALFQLSSPLDASTDALSGKNEVAIVVPVVALETRPGLIEKGQTYRAIIQVWEQGGATSSLGLRKGQIMDAAILTDLASDQVTKLDILTNTDGGETPPDFCLTSILPLAPVATTGNENEALWNERIERLKNNPHRLARIRQQRRELEERIAFHGGEHPLVTHAKSPVIDAFLSLLSNPEESANKRISLQRARIWSMPDLNQRIEVRNAVGPVEAIVSLADYLESKGIDFIYVSIPFEPELSIHEFFPELDSWTSIPRLRFLEDLSQAGVETIDLLPALRDDKSGKPMTFPTVDPHLSFAGTRVVAQTLADYLKVHYAEYVSQVPQVQYRKKTFAYESDPGFTEEVSQIIEPDGQLFGNPSDSPILVIGDCNTFYWQVAKCKNAGITAQMSEIFGGTISQFSGPNFLPHQMGTCPPEVLSGRKIILYMQSPWTLYFSKQPFYRPVFAHD